MFPFSRWRWSHWLGILIWSGSILRLYGLWWANRWYDEIFGGWVATLPFANLLAATAGDVHPPGYYALLWAVANLTGSNAVWLLRLPSAACAIPAMPVLALIARRLKWSEGATLGAVALMAFSPFQIYFAQETRMYALLQLEVLLAVLAVLDRRWWLFTLAGAAMLYTHNYGLVYLGVLGMWALIREANDGSPLAVFWSGALAAALYMPWLPIMAQQAEGLASWWQQPTTMGGWLEPITRFVYGYFLLGMLAPLGDMVIFALVAFGLWRLLREREANVFQVSALCFAPMIISVATEWAGMHSTYLYRSFIGSSGLLYLLLGWALERRRLAWCALGPLMALAVIVYYPYTLSSKGASSDVLEAVTQRMAPGDLVYHMNAGSLMTAREIHPDRPELYQYVHPAFADDMGTLSSSTLAAFGIQEAELEQLPWRRAWLVMTAGPTIGLSEDREALAMVDRFAGERVMYGQIWTEMYEAQVWLLTR